MRIIVAGFGVEFEIAAYRSFGIFGGIAVRNELSSSRQKGVL